MVVLNDSRQIIFMNPAAELMLGCSARQSLNRCLHDVDPGFGELDVLIQRSIESQQTFGQNLALSSVHGERSPTLVSCRVSPVPGLSSTNFILELLDASHWRQLDREKSLVSQRGASRRIIRQLAHEIRNPLGGLRGAAQLLERELQQPALREYTQVIIREADRLVTLTDNLLGPTRQPSRESLNIHELTERVLLLAQSEASSGIRFYRDYDPSLPPLSGDQDQLLQALLNIVRNAVQSVGDDGDILIRTRVLTGYVLNERRHRLIVSIEVEDNGPGIPEDIADSVFYPLVTGREGGTGLGLPLAQDLISRHGGLIEFESAPGRTVFMTRLPIDS